MRKPPQLVNYKEANIVDLSAGKASTTQARKADHIRICLQEDVQSQNITNGLEHYRFTHNCLPELNLSQIDISTEFLGKVLNAPLLISSMTGGTEAAKIINYRLAEVAQHYNLAMGVGSQRILLEKPELAHTFTVRRVAPNILLLANMGAVQLNYNYGLTQCLKLVEILEADALILHLNPLQECIQAEGDTNFGGLLHRIDLLCSQMPVPVIAKEVGNGISATMARQLIEAGISAIDVAGAGGTSWAMVESERAATFKQRRLGRTFRDWGIPTATCITSIREISPHIPLVASGGLRNGLEAAKAIALGADMAGLALPLLQAASESVEALQEQVELLIAEIATVLFCTGNANLSELRNSNCLQRLP